ncbi:MAG: hypothetical protein CMN02_14440 [Roseibacillus sp.]|nr:hypothetical protein [Roseibacillus sp.]
MKVGHLINFMQICEKIAEAHGLLIPILKLSLYHQILLQVSNLQFPMIFDTPDIPQTLVRVHRNQVVH